MARIFMTGLETQSLTVFDGYGGSTVISTSEVRTGGASLSLPSANCYATKSLSGDPAEIYVRLGVYHTSNQGNADPPVLSFQDSANADQLTLTRHRTEGTLSIRRGTYNGTVLATSAEALLTGTWHCIELYVKVADSGGIVQVKVNGDLWIDYTGDTKQTANANIGYVRFGGVTSSPLFVMLGYYDDIAVNDTSGAANNSWIGQGGIHGIVPTGAGASTDLTPSAGANWQCVDEVPPNDETDYVEGNTVDDHDSYAMGNLTPTAGAISAVCWWARARIVEGGTGKIARVVRPSATDRDGADQALSTAWEWYSDIMDVSPETSAAWTISEVNATEAGVRVR